MLQNTWGGVESGYGVTGKHYELKLGDGHKRVHYTTIFVYAYIFLFLLCSIMFLNFNLWNKEHMYFLICGQDDFL